MGLSMGIYELFATGTAHPYVLLVAMAFILTPVFLADWTIYPSKDRPGQGQRRVAKTTSPVLGWQPPSAYDRAREKWIMEGDQSALYDMTAAMESPETPAPLVVPYARDLSLDQYVAVRSEIFKQIRRRFGLTDDPGPL